MKFNKILDILYPRRCPVCGDITGGSGRMICPDCLRKLSFVKSPVCKKCGKEIEDESMEFCPDCMRRIYFDFCTRFVTHEVKQQCGLLLRCR